MRLDKYVAEKLNISREKAQEKIKNNLVSVNDKIINKPAYEVNESNEIKIIKQKDYVSRGAYKLLGTIKAFSLDFNDKVVLDLGASTGGFTQVALENNAKKVYAVDIGENQLADVLKNDKRIVNLSKTDVRNLNANLVNDSQIVIGDLSFISLTKILPTIKTLFNDKKEMMLLFKPQFECGPIIAKKYHKKANTIKCDISQATKMMCMDCSEKVILDYFNLPDYIKPTVKQVIFTVLNKL